MGLRLGWVWRIGRSVEVGLLLAEWLDPSSVYFHGGTGEWVLMEGVGPVLGMWLAVWTQVVWRVSDTYVLGNTECIEYMVLWVGKLHMRWNAWFLGARWCSFV